MIFKRSENVPEYDDHLLYRDRFLRPDFNFRCAYCLIHERLFLEVGGGEIDHHRPLKPPARIGRDFQHLRNVYANLYWTCGRCNQAKSNKWPSDEEYQARNRFLDPCLEDHVDHWMLHEDGTLTALTSIGSYTIMHIGLNCAFLVRMRLAYLNRRRQIAEVRRKLTETNLTEDERELINRVLADDFLLNPPAFVI